MEGVVYIIGEDNFKHLIPSTAKTFTCILHFYRYIVQFLAYDYKLNAISATCKEVN